MHGACQVPLEVGLTEDSIVAKVRNMLGEIIAAARLTEAAREAHRRDRADAAKLRAAGWTIAPDGSWIRESDDGRQPDGPGTPNALAKHFNAVVKERGLTEDVALVGSGIQRLLAAAAARMAPATTGTGTEAATDAIAPSVVSDTDPS